MFLFYVLLHFLFIFFILNIIVIFQFFLYFLHILPNLIFCTLIQLISHFSLITFHSPLLYFEYVHHVHFIFILPSVIFLPNPWPMCPIFSIFISFLDFIYFHSIKLPLSNKLFKNLHDLGWDLKQHVACHYKGPVNENRALDILDHQDDSHVFWFFLHISQFFNK